jgi:hypothetical protein
MRPIRVTVSSATVSAPIPLDTYQDPLNVSIGVVLSAGASLTYSVQHTFDDVFAKNFDPSTATWFNNSGLTAKTTSLDGNYNMPVTAVRLNVTSFTSGTATMTVIQAGMPGR